MVLSVSATCSAGVNCTVSGIKIIPGGDFSYLLTLTINGATTITNVSYIGGAPLHVSVVGGMTLWNVSIAPSENVFPNEYFDFVKYDDQFDPTFFQRDSAAEIPEDSTIYKYTPPDPMILATTFSFLVNYTIGQVESPIAGSEIITVPQLFVWNPEIGLGQLDTAIENSRY